MKIKSHFEFSKQQRDGVFWLLLLIAIVQGVYFFVAKDAFSATDTKLSALNTKQIAYFVAEIDSLKKVKAEALKPKIYPFNPNFITDYKGYKLGMTNEEINRLLHYREKGKWINSTKQFQEVTLISDSLLELLSPNFKFPDWITNPKKFSNNNKRVRNAISATNDQKIDLNTASAFQLQKINGIGEKLSQRIIDYRSKQNGFVSEVELTEVYGLSKEVIQRVANEFPIMSPRKIISIKLNTASREELVRIKYIDYDIAFNIIEQRTLRGGYKSIDELKKVKDFPLNKFDIIRLYLQLN